jgi:hypothetical protein
MQPTAPQLIRTALSDCFPASALVSLVNQKKITKETACRAWNARGGYFNLYDCAETERDYSQYHDI